MSFSRSVVQAGAVSTHVARRGRQIAKHALAVAVCLACLGVPLNLFFAYIAYNA